MSVLRTTRSFRVVMCVALVSVAYAVPAPSAAPADRLGRQWRETESGWQGVWIRRGNSHVFDARWGSGPGAVAAVLTMSLAGSKVTIQRRRSTDGNDCDYTGTIAADGVTVQGTYTCTGLERPFPWLSASGLPKPWRATIQR